MSVKKDESDRMQLVEESPFPLTDIDKWVLSQTDEEFHLHNWEELKEIIGTSQYFVCLMLILYYFSCLGRPLTIPLCKIFYFSFSLFPYLGALYLYSMSG
jgi:hypothetical protein